MEQDMIKSLPILLETYYICFPDDPKVIPHPDANGLAFCDLVRMKYPEIEKELGYNLGLGTMTFVALLQKYMTRRLLNEKKLEINR